MMSRERLAKLLAEAAETLIHVLVWVIVVAWCVFLFWLVYFHPLVAFIFTVVFLGSFWVMAFRWPTTTECSCDDCQGGADA